MKKIIFLAAILAASSSFAMVRAGVNVGPEPGVYYDDGYYYNTWYGPGWYYGSYYGDYPSYYAWQRRYYYGGPYYYRSNYHHGGDRRYDRRYDRRH